MKQYYEMETKALALFDFDGTITNRDTVVEFTKYAVGKMRFYSGIFVLSPYLIAYALRLITLYSLKNKFMVHFFKDWPVDKFDFIAVTFSLEKIDQYINQSALEMIQWHKRQCHDVVVVSASFENWLKPWCKKNGLDLISSHLEVCKHKITGNFATKNCSGKEKVVRINEKYDLGAYHQIYAYGDSNGDKEMLEIATKSYFQKF